MSQLAEDLKAAKALIADPARWCKGIARNQNCTMYAVSVVAGQGSGAYRFTRCDEALRQALPRTIQLPFGGAHPIVAFNDAPETTHADVLALFDRAIAAAEAQRTKP
jgi:hypothetical protein